MNPSASDPIVLSVRPLRGPTEYGPTMDWTALDTFEDLKIAEDTAKTPTDSVPRIARVSIPKRPGRTWLWVEGTARPLPVPPKGIDPAVLRGDFLGLWESEKEGPLGLVRRFRLFLSPRHLLRTAMELTRPFRDEARTEFASYRRSELDGCLALADAYLAGDPKVRPWDMRSGIPGYSLQSAFSRTSAALRATGWALRSVDENSFVKFLGAYTLYRQYASGYLSTSGEYGNLRPDPRAIDEEIARAIRAAVSDEWYWKLSEGKSLLDPESKR